MRKKNKNNMKNHIAQYSVVAFSYSPFGCILYMCSDAGAGAGDGEGGGGGGGDGATSTAMVRKKGIVKYSCALTICMRMPVQ